MTELPKVADPAAALEVIDFALSSSAFRSQYRKPYGSIEDCSRALLAAVQVAGWTLVPTAEVEAWKRIIVLAKGYEPEFDSGTDSQRLEILRDEVLAAPRASE